VSGSNIVTVTARDAAGNTAADVVTVTLSGNTTFSDDPVAPQSTPIRAVHVMELRVAIDSARAVRGLAPFGWTGAPLGPGAPVKAVHLTELRVALNQAYQAASRPVPTYTDAAVAAGVTVIKAIHLNELRAAVRAL
jgi:hypothetical protein